MDGKRELPGAVSREAALPHADWRRAGRDHQGQCQHLQPHRQVPCRDHQTDLHGREPRPRLIPAPWNRRTRQHIPLVSLHYNSIVYNTFFLLYLLVYLVV